MNEPCCSATKALCTSHVKSWKLSYKSAADTIWGKIKGSLQAKKCASIPRAAPAFRADDCFCYFPSADHENWFEHASMKPFVQRLLVAEAHQRELHPRGIHIGEEIEMSAGTVMAHADSPSLFSVFADTALSVVPQVSDFYALPSPRGAFASKRPALRPA